MLIALGAAGVTVAVMLGVIGIPVVGACSDDPRGLVTCLRDMANRKFDLAGSLPAPPRPAPAAIVEHAAPTVVVDLPPPPASAELQAKESGSDPIAPSPRPLVVAEVPKTAAPVPLPSTVAAPLEAPTAESLAFAVAPMALDTPPIASLQPQPETASVPEAAAPPTPPMQPPVELAKAEPAISQAPPASVAAPVVLAPTIDAIELDGEASFVSGSGPAGALMRLYADGELIGESPVEQGRWLVEGRNLLDSPRRLLRVEAIEPETGKLLGFAAITVEIELPEQLAPPAERPAQPPAFGSSVAPDAPPVPAPAALAEAPTIAVPPSASPAARASEPVAATPATAPPRETETETETEAVAAPVLPDPVEPTEPLPELLALTPLRESASVDILPPSGFEPATLPPLGGSGGDAALVVVAPPAAPALVAAFDLPRPRPPGQPVTVLRLLPFGDPDSGRYNVGKAIIRHGDTLWSLARRYYGHGIHYRTIFHANRDLIRRPSRIFPGQVFDLPLVTDD